MMQLSLFITDFDNVEYCLLRYQMDIPVATNLLQIYAGYIDIFVLTRVL